jgi:hypothetical protein
MPDAPSTLEIQGGTCLAVFAFEVGTAIDLDQAEQRWRAGRQRESIRHSRRAPPHFEFRPAPLRLDLDPAPLEVAGRAVTAVDAVLFDFGALSVAYALPIAGPIEGLLALAVELSEAPTLLADARARAAGLLAFLGPAVRRPALADVVEDYVIFQVTAHAAETATPMAEADLASWLAANRQLLARILRAERGVLARQEVDDALAHRLSYAEGDAVFVDWNAALLFDPHPHEVTAALEFANVELLEMRHLDDLLDEALEETYALLDRGRTRRPSNATLDRISALELDAAMLFESVNNALKLLGDQYLARLYQAACQRFHLPEWDQNILRKLGTLDGIYQKLVDRRTNRRMEVLEWIIIGLIAFEVGYSLWG